MSYFGDYDEETTTSEVGFGLCCHLNRPEKNRQRKVLDKLTEGGNLSTESTNGGD